MQIPLTMFLVLQVIVISSEKHTTTTDVVQAFLVKKFGSLDVYDYKSAKTQSSANDKYNKRKADFESNQNVLPLKQPRGVLDMVLPPERVQSFKSALDGFKRLLSYTFRR